MQYETASAIPAELIRYANEAEDINAALNTQEELVRQAASDFASSCRTFSLDIGPQVADPLAAHMHRVSAVDEWVGSVASWFLIADGSTGKTHDEALSIANAMLQEGPPVIAENRPLPIMPQDLDALNGVLDPGKLAQLRGLLAEYQELLAQGMLTQSDADAIAQALQQLLAEARKLKHYDLGDPSMQLFQGALGLTGALAADDLTGVGALDDPLMIITGGIALTALGIYFVNRSHQIVALSQALDNATDILLTQLLMPKQENEITRRVKEIMAEKGVTEEEALEIVKAEVIATGDKEMLRKFNQAKKFLGRQRIRKQRAQVKRKGAGNKKVGGKGKGRR